MRWLAPHEPHEGEPIVAARLLAWAIVARPRCFGLIGSASIPKIVLRVVRNHLNEHPASGDIVLVGIDDKSLAKSAAGRGRASRYAEMIDEADRRRRTARSSSTSCSRTDQQPPQDDALLAEAIKRSGKRRRCRQLPASERRDGDTSGRPPAAAISPKMPSWATISVCYNYAECGLAAATMRAQVDGKSIPYALRRNLPGANGAADRVLRVNYSIDPKPSRRISAATSCPASIQRRQLRGKNVVIGVDRRSASATIYFIPGLGQDGRRLRPHHRRRDAEGRKAGRSGLDSALPARRSVLLCLPLAASSLAQQLSSLGVAAAVVLLSCPMLLEAHSDLRRHHARPVRHAWVAVGSLARRALPAQRGLINTVSGLPNLNALRANRHGRDQAADRRRASSTMPRSPRPFRQSKRTPARRPDRRPPDGRSARSRRSTRATTAFSPGSRTELPRSAIMSRRSTPCSATRPGSTACRSTCRSASASRSAAAARCPTASAARWSLPTKPRTTASSGNITIRKRCKDASWKLSLLSQLDEAIDKGEVWVAYQPKLDLQTRARSSAPRRWRAGPTRKRARSRLRIRRRRRAERPDRQADRLRAGTGDRRGGRASTGSRPVSKWR